MKPLAIVRMIINALAKPKQRINLTEIAEGRIIDIGGGGEGVIAQVGGARVVAIDKYMSEINEARNKAPDSQWMVADATELPYQRYSIDGATAFFSCMYMPESVKTQVFRETYHVLKKGGEFWIWDVNMHAKSNVFAIRLQVDTPGKTIRTVYGVQAKDHSAASFTKLLQEAGFETDLITDHKYWFFIKAKRL